MKRKSKQVTNINPQDLPDKTINFAFNGEGYTAIYKDLGVGVWNIYKGANFVDPKTTDNWIRPEDKEGKKVWKFFESKVLPKVVKVKKGEPKAKLAVEDGSKVVV